MEMESTRRSIDRSRELAAKKPRLIEENGRSRMAINAIAPPKKTEFIRQSQPSQTQAKTQQHNQEVVTQYKEALADLTFNSKPIITNLTIIAGENLHVAKWIAATVCANIIEVPSDQKLPSLYLLDSIVKNIGKDYIKQFAVKLPEVFCKAYRQVDSPIHTSMRHLFGTWKGVFPPGCLQTIEKELGFTTAANGSSGTMPSKSEPQSQRPPHSIHVNPKYLEARQRSLQQASRVKGANTSSEVSVPSDDDEPERPDRKRPWSDLAIKEFKQAKTEASSESLHEDNTGYEDNEYTSNLSRNSDLAYARARERVTGQDVRDKSWYADRSATEASASQRNTFENPRELSKNRASWKGVGAVQMQPKGATQSLANNGSRLKNKSWKNSEEEEYMWDDMNTRFPAKENWGSDDAERVETEDHLPQPREENDSGSRFQGDAFTDQRGQSTFGRRMSPTWQSKEPHLGDGSRLPGLTSRISGQSEGHPSSFGAVSTGLVSSLTRQGAHSLTGMSTGGIPSVGTLANTIPSLGVLGQNRPHQAASPSGLPMLLHPSSPSSITQHPESQRPSEDERLQTRPVSMVGQITAHHSSLPHWPYGVPAQSGFLGSSNHVQSGGLQNNIQSQSPQGIQNSSSSVHTSQRQHQNPFSLQSLPEPTASQPSGQFQKPLLQSSVIADPRIKGLAGLSHVNNSAVDITGQSNTSSVLANLMRSGILSNNLVSDSSSVPPLFNRPPLPSGPHPAQLATSSAPMVASNSLLDPRAAHSQRVAALPPLPPGPPPSSQTSGVSKDVPFQSLLSSLVAKGLISPEKESSTRISPQVPSQTLSQSLAVSTTSSFPVIPKSSPANILGTIRNDFPLTGSAAKSPSTPQATRTETKDLIGTEFKVDIIRQSHPSVISSLFDDLPHTCNVCGLRFKIQQQLDRHTQQHALRGSEPNGYRASVRWFPTSGDWICGNVNSSICTTKPAAEEVEKNDPAVPADETQCVCLLCGDPFEDFYSHERDEWMFKGAIYLPIPAPGADIGVGVTVEGPIVHKDCISPSSVYDLGLLNNVKQEQANR